MPWNALDTHVPAFIILVDCIRYTFVLRGRPMSTQTHTHTYARMRIRNDTQSKRDSRVNEKVNNRCVFARSHLRPHSAEAIRDTLGHWGLQRRGNVELVLRDGIFRIVNRSENRGKSQRIDVVNVETERLMRSRPIVVRGSG